MWYYLAYMKSAKQADLWTRSTACQWQVRQGGGMESGSGLGVRCEALGTEWASWTCACSLCLQFFLLLLLPSQAKIIFSNLRHLFLSWIVSKFLKVCDQCIC